VLKETSALPAVCGRVCPQERQCESKCIYNKMRKEPVAIGYLERTPVRRILPARMCRTQRHKDCRCRLRPRLAVIRRRYGPARVRSAGVRSPSRNRRGSKVRHTRIPTTE
jgi:hypothetical protein